MTATPLLRWLSSSGADALGRFLIQLGSTIVFARLLAPEIFGQAALTLALVTVLTIAVTAPVEEALSQKRVVGKRHFQACLFAMLVLAAALCLTVGAITQLLPLSGADARLVADLVAVYCLTLFADGPIAVHTAIARRHRRFHRIAVANVTGLAGGTAVGLILAFAGAGVWSLIAVRFVARFLSAACLMAGARVRLLPVPALKPLRSLARFAGWHFADRCTTAVADALFQILVAGLYGLAANGYLNMAMRVVEPVRSATAAIGHNIAMSIFARMQGAPERLRPALERTLIQTSLALLPVFVGLAVIAPTLVDVLAGPGWWAAAEIAVFLALAAALTAPTNFIYSAVSARGRADIGFAVSFCDLLVTVAALLWLMPLGIVAIGLARLAAYGTDSALAVWIGRRLFALNLSALAQRFAPIGIALAMMAAAVTALPLASPGLSAPLLLALQVGLGALVYAVVIRALAGAALRGTALQLVRRSSADG